MVAANRAAPTSCSSIRRRLQTKTNLMEELKKMRRVIERETGAPPCRNAAVLDGTTGQNALAGEALQRGDAANGRHRNETRLDSKGACSSASSIS